MHPGGIHWNLDMIVISWWRSKAMGGVGFKVRSGKIEPHMRAGVVWLPGLAAAYGFSPVCLNTGWVCKNYADWPFRGFISRLDAYGTAGVPREMCNARSVAF
jgi:hypothetical protein